MANQVHIGRLSFTSPASLDFSGGGGQRDLSLSGKLAETNIAEAKYIRDELIAMAQSMQYVPFRYDGDSSFDGFVYVTDSSVDIARYTLGGINYQISMEYMGKVGEIVKESVMTGKLIDNNHSITSTTNQFHVPPANHYNYFHESDPTNGTRLASDQTTTSSSDTVSLQLKTSNNLRQKNAQYHVNPADFYKGAVRIITDSKLRQGLNSPNTPAGAIIENGILKIVIGSSANQSRFTTSIWDATSFASEQEYAVHRGTPTSGQQLATEYQGWKSIQILRNMPELCIIRCTSNFQSSGQDRLTMDISLRRGAHHASIIFNQSPKTSRLNLSVSSAPGSSASSATGYIKAGANDSDGNKFIFGSPVTFTSDLTRGLIHPTTGGTQFKTFVGYELAQTNGSINSGDAADSVRDQYLDNVSEYCKIIKA
jgi:hypothetical protein